MTGTWPALRGPDMPVHAPSGVPGLIRRRHDVAPHAIACADDTRTLTLRELELLSDVLADRLREIDAPGPVVIRLPRDVDRAVAMLGVLKSGRAFLPVDPAEPGIRVTSMVRQARPVAVIGELPGLPGFTVPRHAGRDGEPAPLPAVAPDQPVYVMFTSGSTGEPKGVVLGSAALCSRLLWMQRRYPIGPADRVLQKTPYTFDPSAWELFWPLLAGARCELAPEGAHRDPARLAEVMARRGITVCHFVPSMLAEFVRVAGPLPALRHVFCSGEALSAALARQALDRWPAQLHNLYGPTEAAIDVTFWDVPPGLAPSGPVLIGHPVDNTVLAVIDDGAPVTPGEPGELWIGGVQLAEGYAGRPDLTAAAFPVAGGRRWYRTGDLVRETADGLHYLGRLDDQVKIGGVRVEPLEVEAVLGEVHTPVAVVPADSALVAVLAGDATVTDEELRNHAAARLPAAMVPAAVHRVPALPRNSSGKLDRRRLSELVRTARAGRRDLDSLWADAVAGPCDEHTGFVSAGGTSLAAIRLVRALRETAGVELTVGRLLNDLSLAELRALARESPARPVAPTEKGHRTTAPLAPEQRRLWLLGRVHPDSPAYNVGTVVRFPGGIDPAALQAALDAAVRRHDILRARIDATPALHFEPGARVRLVVEETTEPLAAARKALTTVLPADRAPMLHAALLRADGDSWLVLVFNHLVADQETADLVLADIAAALRGETLPPAPSYAGYATAAQRESPEWTDDLEYWRTRLDGAPPELLLPFRLADPPRRDFEGAAEVLRLSPDFRSRLDSCLRARNATTAGFFLAVFAAVLAAWSGQDTLVIGLPSAHRRSAAPPGLAGFLVDTLPVRLDLAGLRTFDDLLRHARARYTEAMDHAAPPFDAVVTAVNPQQPPNRDRVFQVWLNDLTGAAPAPGFPGVRAELVPTPVHSALFDLGLYLFRDGDGLAVQLVRAVTAYPREVARELLAQCGQLATRALADPDLVLAELDLVTDSAPLPEPDRPLPPAGPRESVLGDLAEVVATRPDAIAVSAPSGDLTYRELWAHVRRSAHRPGDTVVIEAARTADLPIALLSCWSAGATAALVDATLPAARKQDCRRLLETAPPEGTSHVLFTSGTTGAPLPVAVPHGPLRDFLRWYLPEFGIGPADRFALLAGPGHDPVLREIFGALLAGARLCVPPAGAAAEVGGPLLDWLADTGITVLHATPALLELMVRVAPRRLPELRLVVVGGAPLTWGLVRRVRQLTGAEIVNAYGSTETPQIVSCHRIRPGEGDGLPDGAQVPVGAGVAGQDLLVLTPEGRLAGVGQRGEVVVRGRNLASGYVGAGGGRFADDPEPGLRRVRTGDLGRYGPDGLVHLDGRLDRQISVDGHRVELGEVEATALRHPLVRQAVASCPPGAIGPVLTLEVTTAGPITGAELRGFLRNLLPGHAVPAVVRIAGNLALGPTGKTVAAAPPSTEAERALAAIEATIAEVLGRAIGPDENFFDAGLTSLALVQLHEVSTRELTVDLPVTAMFAHPNLRALRRHLAGEATARPVPVRPADTGQLRRVGAARRELRRRIRAESERS
ncbi:amino acid adenylation domain-containing protein [Amycolatopsis sacchari]|uniref:amino acid adenylation domain-containing protein n=1 Tax=Amycolatopsis sacchari TaxID=115433 RepID=UPI003D72B67B